MAHCRVSRLRTRNATCKGALTVTRTQAIRRAVERAKQTRSERYVIWSPEDTDPAGDHFHVATEDDLDAYYLGARVDVYVSPEGTIES